ncbi:hypothetical protein [Clostridium omnivorum]|uniref:Uncharacterized protein n=1 Tax=Clostridium omnivorum TaxID=1604902 RepID=A0ABQ5N646_9CLOT|nr:hypothetical protein [Clostridium sp. E14]GLC30705.1 hypothetical protein bsdE14_21150 [Clostridium sp. E14]
MKKIIPNLILMVLGIISILLVSVFSINGALGCLLITFGLILLLAGIVYKVNNPIKVIVEMIINLF